MREALGVYSEREDAPLPPHLDGVPCVYSTGDVGHLVGSSARWIGEEVRAGRIKPAVVNVRWRHGRWEPHNLFEPAEVERYMRSKVRPRAGREPRQLNLPMFGAFNGGKT